MLTIESLTSDRLLLKSSVSGSYLLLLTSDVRIIHILDVRLMEGQVVDWHLSLFLNMIIFCVNNTLPISIYFSYLALRMNSSIRTLRRPSSYLSIRRERLLVRLGLRFATLHPHVLHLLSVLRHHQIIHFILLLPHARVRVDNVPTE